LTVLTRDVLKFSECTMKKNEGREPKSEQMAICAAPMHRVWQRVQMITERGAKLSRNKQYHTFIVEFEGGEGQRKRHTVVFATAIANNPQAAQRKKHPGKPKQIECANRATHHIVSDEAAVIDLLQH
jgi:hypothetical protein